MSLPKKERVRLWIGNQPDPKDGTVIEVSAKDSERIHNRGVRDTAPTRVKDLLTKKFVTVRKADCGLNCFCALEFVSENGNQTELLAHLRNAVNAQIDLWEHERRIERVLGKNFDNIGELIETFSQADSAFNPSGGEDITESDLKTFLEMLEPEN